MVGMGRGMSLVGRGRRGLEELEEEESYDKISTGSSHGKDLFIAKPPLACLLLRTTHRHRQRDERVGVGAICIAWYNIKWKTLCMCVSKSVVPNWEIVSYGYGWSKQSCGCGSVLM